MRSISINTFRRNAAEPEGEGALHYTRRKVNAQGEGAFHYTIGAIMGIRRKLVDYSRGNNLGCFWKLYRLQKEVGEGFFRDILTFLMSRCAYRHGGYIGPDAVIKGNLSLPHGLQGIFISRYASIGEDCWIYQNVTIGEVDSRAPVIGDHCLIGAGAIIIGDVKIGDNVKIGAGAVVTTDIPDGCTVVSQPVRIIV